MMAESYQDKFKTELYKKYEVCRKVLILKDAYFTMLEDLKTAAADTGTKNRHGYYLLSKENVFQYNQCQFNVFLFIDKF